MQPDLRNFILELTQLYGANNTMPSLNPGLPLLKASDLTKQLRSRNSGQTLLSLLSLAQQLLYGIREDGTILNVYFPKKEDWLVEWVVQRLREEEGDGGVEARLSWQFWAFLLALLQKTDGGVAARCLRKHGFLQLVAMTMEDCRKRDWVEEGTWQTAQHGGGNMWTNSSYPEIKKGDPWQGARGPLEPLNALLQNVATVVAYVEQLTMKTVASRTNAAPVLRGSPELGGQILGRYLDNLHRVIATSGESQDLLNVASGTSAMVGLWKGCVYGNADVKKISAIFSKTCLLSLHKILSSKEVDAPHMAPLQELVLDFIFAPAFTAAASVDLFKTRVRPEAPSLARLAREVLERELCILLSPLEGLGKDAGAATGLVALMEVVITKIIPGTCGNLATMEIAEGIFASFIAVTLGVQLHGTLEKEDVFPEIDANIIHSLLVILLQHSLSISDIALRKIVDLAANLPTSRHQDCSNVRWPIIELALKLDFDTFILSQSTSLLERLVFALSASWAISPAAVLSIEQKSVRKSLLRIINFLLEGFIRARDLDGFLTFWRNELEVLNVIGGETRLLSSIWTSEGVITMFSDALERGYLSSKIGKVITTYTQSISEVDSLVNIFLLDCILRGVRRGETEETLRSTGVVRRLVSVLGEGLRTAATFNTPWLGWQLLYRVLQIDTSFLSIDLLKGQIYTDALETVRNGCTSTAPELGGWLACLQILFLFVLHNYGDRASVSNCIEVFFSSQKQQTGYLSCPHWDGAILSLVDSNLVVAVMYLIVKRWLRVVEALDEREDILMYAEFFIEAAANSLPSEDQDTITPRDIWNEMLRLEVLYELPKLRVRIIQTLCRHHAESVAHYTLFLDSLSKFPVEAIRPASRTTVARLIFDQTFWKAWGEQVSVDTELRSKLVNKERSLMSRLMDLPTTESVLPKDPNCLLQWFDSLDWFCFETRPAQISTIAAGEKVLRRAMSNIDQSPKHIAYLSTLFKALAAAIGGGEAASPYWQLALLCIQICYNSSTGCLKETLEILRIEMLRSADSWLGNTSDPHEAAVLLQIYGKTLVLGLQGHDDLTLTARRMVEQMIDQWLPQWISAPTLLAQNQERLQDVLVELIGLQCICPQSPASISSTVALVIFALQNPATNSAQKSSILHRFTSMVTNLSSSASSQAISILSETCFPFSPSTPLEYYTLLSTLFTAIKKPSSPSDTSKLRSLVSKIYSLIAISLTNCTTDATFLTLTSCLHTLLRSHSWCITQFNIDETLSAIALSTSPNGPCFSLNTTTPDDIYTSLTSLLLAIILGHRLRLKGRYHLLISALQSLLRCLYSIAPYRRKMDKAIHPPWLSNTTGTALSSISAAAYTRLITTLCYPPASTVTKHNRTALLTPRTALARKEIARYVPYLVMEFVWLQLQLQRLSLPSEHREPLTQGLYAMFDVMKSEEGTLKKTSAGLDAQGKALFKRLYEDFSRFGIEK